MLKNVLLIVLMSIGIAGAGLAQTLDAQTFQDQWDQPAALNTEVEWLIFSHHKDGAAWVKESLDALNIKDLQARHWLYVADISQMPGFVTRLFALPKMKDYAFPIALVRDEALIGNWPRDDETVSVYRLADLQIEEVSNFSSQEELQRFLAGMTE
ncbi:MAG: hypothetical protein KDJ38_06370 [Gammaproteobacteria bacterium]|nr:hypothetical protein [Gammaproteobacteria bacterium]